MRVGNESLVFLSSNEGGFYYVTNHSGLDPNVTAPTGCPLRDENGNGNIKGLVKDGSFYLFFNDQQVLSRKMSDLFTDYNESSSVSMGFGTWWSGGLHFSNVKYLSPEEVDATVVTAE